jgi:pimeloyl-ACP methyl ester carboxylesterase
MIIIMKAQQLLMKLKLKYGMGINAKAIKKIVMKSPVFRFSDIIAMLKAPKLSSHLYETLMDFRAPAAAFSVPVFFIHGGNDSQVPPELAEEYLDKLSAPDKGFYKIENAGHIVFADKLSEVQSVTLEIIARLKKAAPV